MRLHWTRCNGCMWLRTWRASYKENSFEQNCPSAGTQFEYFTDVKYYWNLKDIFHKSTLFYAHPLTIISVMLAWMNVIAVVLTVAHECLTRLSLLHQDLDWFIAISELMATLCSKIYEFVCRFPNVSEPKLLCRRMFILYRLATHIVYDCLESHCIRLSCIVLAFSMIFVTASLLLDSINFGTGTVVVREVKYRDDWWCKVMNALGRGNCYRFCKLVNTNMAAGRKSYIDTWHTLHFVCLLIVLNSIYSAVMVPPLWFCSIVSRRLWVSGHMIISIPSLCC